MPGTPAILLLDNGSLQPAATLNLRCLAAGLSARAGRSVEPVSLLHSSGIDPARLGAVPAEIFEPAVRRRCAAGVREFVVVPLFFGPSAALTAYVPERVQTIAAQFPELRVRVAAPVIDLARPDDTRVAGILADQVREVARVQQLSRPWVVMVDHGSPQRDVGAVRDRIAAQLASVLGGESPTVLAASMERRDGPEYDFNEPLLERALAGLDGAGVVAPLFFSPGRHAGPEGDIASICAAAERALPGLRAHLAPLVGEHPGLIDILADRLREVLHDAGDA